MKMDLDHQRWRCCCSWCVPLCPKHVRATDWKSFSTSGAAETKEQLQKLNLQQDDNKHETDSDSRKKKERTA